MRRFLKLLLVCSLAVGGCDPTGGDPDGGSLDGAVDSDIPSSDADGDGIDDSWEGRADGRDTDGDGIFDFEDTDSDGDGYPDSEERGTGGGSSPPADSDGDGVYDFQDLDADGNGIPDAVEGDEDADGDGIPNYRDIDDDGDSVRDVLEVGDDPENPIDYDGDGLPDFRDSDSDDDTISDGNEAIPPDTDMDGIPDRHDLDSDNDGWTDAEEAGDADPLTAPVDTDEDGIPDFRDADSDNDGLSDRAEREAGTARDNADTDGDGVTDLVEIGACGGDPSCIGDATDPMSSPRTRGDFVFFEPYEAAQDPERDTLDFATDIRVADVYFLMDTTGSMGTSVMSLSDSIAAFIPMVREMIPDVNIGLGDYQDYPISPFGGSRNIGGINVPDHVYRNHLSITSDDAVAVASTSMNVLGYGGDGPESLIPALYAVATGNTLNTMTEARSCPADTIGYPCFRPGAVPIVIAITDIGTHNGPGGASPYSAAVGAPSYDDTIAALNAANVRVIGIGQGSTGQAHLQAIATATGAVDGAGAPLYSTASGSIGAVVLSQIAQLAAATQFDISIRFEDDPSDDVDTFAAFVSRVETNEAGDVARGCDARTGTDTTGDGFPDTFEGVTSGGRVCFDIVSKQNDTVEPTSAPQVFRATVRVIGDGFTELDSRDVFFLVPPHIDDPGVVL